MKVLLVNGSPHNKGCTNAALNEAGHALEEEDISTEYFWIGNQPIAGCIGCGYCAQKGKCRYDDQVNTFLDMAPKYDGLYLWRAGAFRISSSIDDCFYGSGVFCRPMCQTQLFRL